MPEPYNYTVNIPQPPEQNFLQSLLGIQQLKGLRQQQDIQQQQYEFVQQQQPLQLQQLQQQVDQQKAINPLLIQEAQNKIQQQDEAKAFRQDATKLAEDPNKWDQNNLRSIAMRAAAVAPDHFNAMRALMADLPDRESSLIQRTASATLLGVSKGTPEGIDSAKSIVKDSIMAAEASNLPRAVTMLKVAQSQLESDPGTAGISAASFLASTNPKLAEDTFKMVKLPGEMAKEAATTAEMQAKTKKILGEIPSQEKPLPSSLLRENATIEKEVTAANEMAGKLSQAAEAMRALPSVGGATEWWTNVKPKIGFGENPEIAVRANAAQLAGLGMLGTESKAMGGAIRSNVQFQYATSKLPSAWSAPQELAKRLDAQAEVQSKLAQLRTIDSEWNSAFRGSVKATKDEQILGMDVAPGTTRTQFKEQAAKSLFPPSEPTKTDQITRTPDLTGGTINLGGGNTATFKLKK